MPAGPFNNTLLQHLDREVLDRLQLKRVDLPVLRQLEAPGKQVDYLYFVETGIASMTTAFQNGTQVETSMFGYESVIGVSGLMGVKHSFNNIFMQLGGSGFSCPIQAGLAEFKRGEKFQSLTLRYVQAQLTLSTQNAACNAMHTHEQRLARWLLICGDRAKQDRLELAQEFVAQMLGSTRSTVSIAAAHLKVKGLIDYARGSIQIRDVKGLEAQACECYRVVREHLENFAEFDTGYIG